MDSASPISAPMTSAITGSFAPHGMNVAVMTVMRRSFSFSMVLVANTPGTPHPVDTNMGMKDLPDRPKRRNTRSITNATRAIYPQSSRKLSRTNSTSICGMKPSTAPTPAITPSHTRLITRSLAPSAPNQPDTAAGTLGIAWPNSVQPSPNRLSFTQSVIAVPNVEIAR